MDGLLAALSPTEETALRLIARGIRSPMAFRDSDLARLQRLELIVQTRMGLTVTAAGRHRLE